MSASHGMRFVHERQFLAFRIALSTLPAVVLWVLLHCELAHLFTMPRRRYSGHPDPPSDMEDSSDEYDVQNVEAAMLELDLGRPLAAEADSEDEQLYDGSIAPVGFYQQNLTQINVNQLSGSSLAKML